MPKTVADLSSRWLKRAPGALSEAENRVLQSAVDRATVSTDSNTTFASRRSRGDRLADAVARTGGSWPFIVGFLIFLAAWTAGNVWMLGRASFDPYPFIFLNLVLSMIAALQAPIIMMSQNRQGERDRIAAAHDYEVNLKAEIEIMALHEKLDELRHREIVAVHADISALGEAIRRIEARLSADGRA